MYITEQLLPWVVRVQHATKLSTYNTLKIKLKLMSSWQRPMQPTLTQIGIWLQVTVKEDSHVYVALSLGSLIFSMSKRGRAWYLISCDKNWYGVMKERCRFWIGLLQFYQTQLFEAFIDPTTLPWRLWSYIFKLERLKIKLVHTQLSQNSQCHPKAKID